MQKKTKTNIFLTIFIILTTLHSHKTRSELPNESQRSTDSAQRLSTLGQNASVSVLQETTKPDNAKPSFETDDIYYAIFGGHTEMLQKMVEKNPDIVHTTNRYDGPPLYYAISNFHASDNELKDGSLPWLLLGKEREKMYAESIDILLKNKADLSGQASRSKTTALHLAVKHDLPITIIEKLLTHGSDPRARNIYGETPLTLAQALGRIDAEDAFTKQLKQKDNPWNTIRQDDQLALPNSHIKPQIEGSSEEKKVSLMTEVQIGELIDKITILQIKLERINDPAKLANIKAELDTLLSTYAKEVPHSSHVENLWQQLHEVNKQLWIIEDAIRDKERAQEFDKEFIKFARSVYYTNDKRCRIKRDLNLLAGSRLMEEKSYTDYTDAQKK